jgi:hypothetical protein
VEVVSPFWTSLFIEAARDGTLLLLARYGKPTQALMLPKQDRGMAHIGRIRGYVYRLMQESSPQLQKYAIGCLGRLCSQPLSIFKTNTI